MKKYTVESKLIPSDEQDMEVLILKPTVNVRPAVQTPGILWIHGGGYVTGMARMIYMSRAIDLEKNTARWLLHRSIVWPDKHPILRHWRTVILRFSS